MTDPSPSPLESASFPPPEGAESESSSPPVALVSAAPTAKESSANSPKLASSSSSSKRTLTVTATSSSTSSAALDLETDSSHPPNLDTPSPASASVSDSSGDANPNTDTDADTDTNANADPTASPNRTLTLTRSRTRSHDHDHDDGVADCEDDVDVDSDSSTPTPLDQIRTSLCRISLLEKTMLGRLRGVLDRSRQEEYERRLSEDSLLEGLLTKIALEQKRANTKNAAIAMRWPLVLESVAGAGAKSRAGAGMERTSRSRSRSSRRSVGGDSLRRRDDGSDDSGDDSDSGDSDSNDKDGPTVEIDESGRRVFRHRHGRTNTRPSTAATTSSSRSVSTIVSSSSSIGGGLRDVGETLASQEEMCSAILEGKELLLGELTAFLRNEEDSYVTTLQRHDTQLEQVLETMKSDLKVFVGVLEEELAHIADSFRAAEARLERKQERSFRQLQEERRNLEESYVEKRVHQVEENEVALQKLNVDESENFARTKKEKDERLHELEATIDGLRGIFELTAERLKYYHSVLSERVKENEAAIKDKARNLNQLQEQLTDIKAKYHADDLRFKQKNAELTQHYSRLAKQYKDLVRKFQYFEQQDAKKYQQVWQMNQVELDELSNRLLQADKLITERILHQVWEPPPSHQRRIQDEEQDMLLTTSNLQSTATPSQHEEEEAIGTKDDSSSLQRKRVLLGQLVSQLLFLVPESDRVGPDVELSESERNFLHAHLILRALGVSEASTSTAPSLDRFILMLQKGLASLEEIPSDVSPGSSLPIVSQDAVVNTITGALIDHRATLLSPTAGDTTVARRRKRKKKVQVVNLRKLRERKERYQELCFWNAFKRIISKSKIRLWNRVHEEQKKYYVLLKRRRTLQMKNESISRQNEELRMLLNQYSRQKINEQLYIPPQ